MILIDTQKEEFGKMRDISVFGKNGKDDKFNRDLLVIGLGGVGGKVLAAYKGMMKDRIEPEDNINYLLIDSDIPAMEQTIEDSKEHVGLNAMEVLSIYRHNLSEILEKGTPEGPVHETIAKWMKPDFPKVSIGTEGANGNRQVGRLMFANAYEEIRVLLFEKIETIYNKSKIKTPDGKLDVIIVCGIGGGTGSGIIADLAYNIKAFAKSKRWNNFRIAGCLLMPDVLFANLNIADNVEKKQILNANGYATLMELQSLMNLEERGDTYTYENGTHRIVMKDNIFDTCILISGKKDMDGYIPEGVVFSDAAYFLAQLSLERYMGTDRERMLFRDGFFDHDSKYFKVVNESDYRVPVKQIENICEFEVFKETYRRLHMAPEKNERMEADVKECFGSLRSFLSGKPGEELELRFDGIIRGEQFEKPIYKLIKKKQDDLRTEIPRKLNKFKDDLPIIVKKIQQDVVDTINRHLNEYMHNYGPFVTLGIIGASGYGGLEKDAGIIAEIKDLDRLAREMQASGEYERIRDSILAMVAKRWFAFPGAKRETENGYYDACIKDMLEKERLLLRDALSDHDFYGDLIRTLRQRAESIYDIYSQFDEDLKNTISDLSSQAERVVGYMLKKAKRKEFLPSGYVTETRIEDLKRGVISLMVDHENDIDNARVVPIKQEMEKAYKSLLAGIGGYAPEKMLVVAFSDKVPEVSELNNMFATQVNDKRDKVLKAVARNFVDGASEKTEKKKLCMLKKGITKELAYKKTISLPEAMPFFSSALKDVLTDVPYNYSARSITTNIGEMEMSIEETILDVTMDMLECSDEMKEAYQVVITSDYKGLHTY